MGHLEAGWPKHLKAVGVLQGHGMRRPTKAEELCDEDAQSALHSFVHPALISAIKTLCFMRTSAGLCC